YADGPLWIFHERGSTKVNWQAFALTLKLACLVAGILFVVGLPAAYWIAFSRARWKFLVEAIVALPIVLPPTVLGFYILVTLGSRSPIGRAWEAHHPPPLSLFLLSAGGL